MNRTRPRHRYPPHCSIVTPLGSGCTLTKSSRRRPPIDEYDQWAERITKREGDGYARGGHTPWIAYGTANTIVTWGQAFGGELVDVKNGKVTAKPAGSRPNRPWTRRRSAPSRNGNCSTSSTARSSRARRRPVGGESQQRPGTMSTVLITGGADHPCDFTYVRDLARGLLLAHSRRPLHDRLLNVTGGALRTRGELAAIVRQLVPGARVEIGPGLSPNGHLRGPCDLRRARQQLGYEPVFTLETGLADWASALRDSGSEHTRD
ncbi:MAG: hypothetical protein HY332_22150 [Chloroflexi bacterium]|nr:hypothetical protein [Chloroflexota bacterium]